MYEYDSRVRLSEVDQHQRMTLNAVLNYFQDCSTFQSEDLGLGIMHCSERKRAWILSSWQVVVERYPEIGEKIQTSTWATDFKGLFGERNFCMTDENGNDVAYANYMWVYMYIETNPQRFLFQQNRKNWKAFRCADIISTRMSMLITASMCRWHWSRFRKTKKYTRCEWNIRNLQYMVI